MYLFKEKAHDYETSVCQPMPAGYLRSMRLREQKREQGQPDGSTE
jgi:hypothetical protein